jgi:transposase
MHMIGEETSERLDVLPAQYRVIVTHRPKFACRACEKMVQENAPEHLIKSGLPTEAMVASVIVAKYGWHLPLYRQAKMLAMQGIDIDRSTLAFWVGYAAAELAPLYERLKQHLLASSRLAVDETPVPVLDPGRGRTKTGYFWSMARDDRPFGGTDPPAVAYRYAPGRGAVHLHTLLKGYRGIVQSDGYAPYKQLPDDAITLAFCWAHVRRGYFEIARKGNAPIATQARSPFLKLALPLRDLVRMDVKMFSQTHGRIGVPSRGMANAAGISSPVSSPPSGRAAVSSPLSSPGTKPEAGFVTLFFQARLRGVSSAYLRGRPQSVDEDHVILAYCAPLC